MFLINTKLECSGEIQEKELTHDKHLLVGLIETPPGRPKISSASQVNLPARTLIVLNAKTKKTKNDK